ncbi:N-terminal acetyltransferase [Aspergillus brasiliensis]|uniref:N-terminal acetyltransferase n=1 Tax=Aspergillus brasiliensis TaxID=319629 RepID=A0A9W6DH98_9EURO|nr:N-terminal acetyltransferase [Aspergillus brasiliensis]GKZ40515.1 N-terminal acetyltransferase [Aspergillus brasiliensis]
MPATKMPATPYTLDTDQLELYLRRIRYAEHATPTAVGYSRLEQLHKSMEHDSLTALTELKRRHLAEITWGTTALHYSNHHSISIHPACVFEKLVVYATGGRVSRDVVSRDPTEDGYISISHMILIVTISGKKYMVDVGFGRNTPTSPLLLQENTTAQLIAPSEMSLIRAPLAECMDQTQKVWIYQARADPHSPWVAQYSFSEIEFLFEDFNMMNFFTSKSRDMLFTQKLACTRLILDDHTSEPIGVYILAGREVKSVLRGKIETLRELKTEEDRVSALVEYFNVRLHPHEVEGIRGLPSQIKYR